ncbi:MAG: hypothetical protein JWQ88_1310, partial [Rhodoferax sp.]|nr:hypothetical protein [Rhodoferax sp.]
MGIALFSAAALMESLQGVMGWLATRDTRATQTTASPEVWHRPPRARRRPAASLSAGSPMASTASMTSIVQRGHPAFNGGSGNALPRILPSAQSLRGARQPHALQVTQNLHANLACPAAGGRAARALRVVRVFDTRHPAGAGRMVISGRMT